MLNLHSTQKSMFPRSQNVGLLCRTVHSTQQSMFPQSQNVGLLCRTAYNSHPTTWVSCAINKDSPGRLWYTAKRLKFIYKTTLRTRFLRKVMSYKSQILRGSTSSHTDSSLLHPKRSHMAKPERTTALLHLLRP